MDMDCGREAGPAQTNALTNPDPLNRPLIDVSICGIPYQALLDIGADRILVSDQLPGIAVEPIPNAALLLAAQNHQLVISGKTRLEMQIGPQTYPITAYVVPGLPSALILGMPFLVHEQAVVDAARSCFYLGTRTRQTIYWREPPRPKTGLVKVPEVTDDQPTELGDLLREFQDVFETGLQQPTTKNHPTQDSPE